MDKLSIIIPDEWKDIEFLKSKVKELNAQHSIKTQNIYEFRDILLMFVDFNQNRKEKKVCKLRSFQQNLPIYQHKSEILEAIKSYSVILVAGDTGLVLFCVFLLSFNPHLYFDKVAESRHKCHNTYCNLDTKIYAALNQEDWHAFHCVIDLHLKLSMNMDLRSVRLNTRIRL